MRNYQFTVIGIPLLLTVFFSFPFFSMPAAEASLGECAVFDPGTDTLHVPCLEYGSVSYSVSMKLIGYEPYRLEVVNVDHPAGDPGSPECAAYATETNSVLLPCLNYENIYYRVEMELTGASPYLLEVRSVSGSSALVVTVGGLNFVNTILNSGIVEEDRYLYKSLTSLGFGDNIIFLPFHWSRNANDTEESVHDLRSFLRHHLNLAKEYGHKLIIVSHSWGTFLTYSALAGESAGDTPLLPDLIIALGSPLGTAEARRQRGASLSIDEQIVANYVSFWLSRLGFQRSVPVLPHVRRAVNFWAWGDVISGPLGAFFPGAEDVQIDGDIFSTRDRISTSYWHYFDSLQSMPLGDNDHLRSVIRELIILSTLQSPQ